MGGTSHKVIGGASFPAAGDTEWHIEGTSDFNKDGQEDVLWRHYISGANYIWFLNAPSLFNIGYQVSGGAQIPAVADTNWKIEALDDFNSDGTDDIVWRHYPSGSNYVWYLASTLGNITVSGGTALPAVPDNNWKIRGAGDFDQNSTPDILWRNYAWDHNYIWYMSYTLGSNLVPFGGDFLDVDYWREDEIIGVSDFNLDGLPDILWGRNGTGEDMTIQMLDCCPPVTLDWCSLPRVNDINWEPTVE